MRSIANCSVFLPFSIHACLAEFIYILFVMAFGNFHAYLQPKCAVSTMYTLHNINVLYLNFWFGGRLWPFKFQQWSSTTVHNWNSNTKEPYEMFEWHWQIAFIFLVYYSLTEHKPLQNAFFSNLVQWIENMITISTLANIQTVCLLCACGLAEIWIWGSDRNPEQGNRMYWRERGRGEEIEEKTQTNINNFAAECKLNWIYAWN